MINEQIQAWEFGPVVPALYHEFKSFGNGDIEEKALEMNLGASGWEVKEVPPPTEPDAIALLDRIWEVYGTFSAVQLSNMTHEPGTPWDQTVKECKKRNGGRLLQKVGIPDSVIADWFKHAS